MEHFSDFETWKFDPQKCNSYTVQSFFCSVWVIFRLVDRPTQLILVGISICQHTSTKDIAGQSATSTFTVDIFTIAWTFLHKILNADKPGPCWMKTLLFFWILRMPFFFQDKSFYHYLVYPTLYLSDRTKLLVKIKTVFCHPLQRPLLAPNERDTFCSFFFSNPSLFPLWKDSWFRQFWRLFWRPRFCTGSIQALAEAGWNKGSGSLLTRLTRLDPSQETRWKTSQGRLCLFITSDTNPNRLLGPHLDTPVWMPLMPPFWKPSLTSKHPPQNSDWPPLGHPKRADWKFPQTFSDIH